MPGRNVNVDDFLDNIFQRALKPSNNFQLNKRIKGSQVKTTRTIDIPSSLMSTLQCAKTQLPREPSPPGPVTELHAHDKTNLPLKSQTEVHIISCLSHRQQGGIRHVFIRIYIWIFRNPMGFKRLQQILRPSNRSKKAPILIFWLKKNQKWEIRLGKSRTHPIHFASHMQSKALVNVPRPYE